MARKRKKDEAVFDLYEECGDILNGCYLRWGVFTLFRSEDNKGKLPYPWHTVWVGGDKCKVYDIPKEKMQEALDAANPFKGEFCYPINSWKCVNIYKIGETVKKRFYFKDAIILYYKGYNFIVPPNFFEEGDPGMSICASEMWAKPVKKGL